MEMEFKELLELIVQGGTSIIVFIIWYFTFRKSNETAEQAFKKHAQLSEDLIQLLKDEQEYKVMLAGILMRLEEKLSKPVICPITKGGN